MPLDEYSVVAVALERMNEKLDRHDEKFDVIAQTLQKLVAVDIELKTTKDSLSTIWGEVRELKEHQATDGCPAHKAFVAVRAEQLKAYDALAKECEERIEAMDKRIEVLEQKPLKAMDKVWMALLGALGTGIGGYILLKFGVSK